MRSSAAVSQHQSRAHRAPTPPPVPAIRVLCVDDHAVLAEGLKAHFAVDGVIEIVGRLASAEGVAEAIDRLRADVVVLDIEMSGPDAFAVASRLRYSHRRVRVFVLSAHVRDAYIAAAYSAGAAAYFAKSDDLDCISRGIQEVMRNREGTFLLGPQVRLKCRPQDLKRAGDAKEASAPRSKLATLTPRELEVLRLIGKGQGRQHIAAELCRSVKTIDGHQERIMRKLGVATRSELTILAIREGLA
jgi:two-component system, NarL family, response regulator LiaR